MIGIHVYCVAANGTRIIWNEWRTIHLCHIGGGVKTTANQHGTGHGQFNRLNCPHVLRS